MFYDIRSGELKADGEIRHIIFSGVEEDKIQSLRLLDFSVELRTDDGDIVTIQENDFDNLIKALNKARKIMKDKRSIK